MYVCMMCMHAPGIEKLIVCLIHGGQPGFRFGCCHRYHVHFLLAYFYQHGNGDGYLAHSGPSLAVDVLWGVEPDDFWHLFWNRDLHFQFSEYVLSLDGECIQTVISLRTCCLRVGSRPSRSQWSRVTS